MIRISKTDTQEILQRNTALPRQDLKVWVHDSTHYYQLPDGKILIDLKDGAEHSWLLDDEAEFFTRFGQNKQSPVGDYILQGFPNTPEGFYALIKQSVPELEAKLQLSELRFDYTSLKIVDEAIQAKINHDDYFNKIFKWIVPFSYQVLANEENVRVEFEFNTFQNVLEPVLLLNDGRRIKPFIDLSELAMEDYANFSIVFTSKLLLESL